MSETLWCNHLPGPDEVMAAPDKVTAQQRADEHNVWLDRQHWEGKIEFGGNWPERESCVMLVIEWPYDTASHTRDLLKNVYARKPAP